MYPCTLEKFATYLLVGLHGFQRKLAVYQFMHAASLQAMPAQQASCKLATNLKNQKPQNVIPAYYKLAGFESLPHTCLHGFQRKLAVYQFMHAASLQAKPAQQASCKLPFSTISWLASKVCHIPASCIPSCMLQVCKLSLHSKLAAS